MAYERCGLGTDAAMNYRAQQLDSKSRMLPAVGGLPDTASGLPPSRSTLDRSQQNMSHQVSPGQIAKYRQVYACVKQAHDIKQITIQFL